MLTNLNLTKLDDLALEGLMLDVMGGVPTTDEAALAIAAESVTRRAAYILNTHEQAEDLVATFAAGLAALDDEALVVVADSLRGDFALWAAMLAARERVRRLAR